MQKFNFVFLWLMSFISYADTPAYYDFNSGQLILPFVNTPQGSYSAELQLDQNSINTPLEQFNVVKAVAVNSSIGDDQSPSFNIETGVLTLPFVVTQQGVYSATMQIAQESAKKRSGTTRFNITRVVPITPSTRTQSTQGCKIFPANNVWNTPVNTLRVHSRSSAWVNTIGSAKGLWMDFGSGQWEGGTIGLPYNEVTGSTIVKSSVHFSYNDESDVGPYPIPTNYKIEFGNDHHLLTIDKEACQLYELFNARFNNTWTADAGAIWNLNSNQLRPINWTSADAAGLPVFPGLVRYDEVAAGFIGHAMRFTVPSSSSYIWPARHRTAGMLNVLTNTPPFGARFRLKANYNISGFTPALQVILKAMQTYGIINADNGSAWFISGAPDERWDNTLLRKLTVLKGSDFEAVETACMMVNPNSGQADLSHCP